MPEGDIQIAPIAAGSSVLISVSQGVTVCLDVYW